MLSKDLRIPLKQPLDIFLFLRSGCPGNTARVAEIAVESLPLRTFVTLLYETLRSAYVLLGIATRRTPYRLRSSCYLCFEIFH